MPLKHAIKIGKGKKAKKQKSFKGAVKSAAAKGIKNPKAYVATIERNMGINPRTGAKLKKKSKKKK
jgi:hypothetical protein